ncbi:NAD(P)-binding protein [Coniophora puteana RWD-64-598 SS2]|uniref:NAD(P)-binding protein n=1 Tax=Coniophora puteana (strain RWD-64-598) TaxID=741705 RepID=A0A5M3M9S7_CONPW|nr:NAD(P)-binding protein [Coniophora puteana RWD-64-598 SS2]EIW75847.1 NAD(P)-binding protein [Coniophora puteana RWD-64-598 SS2]
MDSSRIWLSTGASSGFGRLMTELALKKGDKVVATLRKPDAIAYLTSVFSAERLLPIALDVTKRDQVKDAFAKAFDHFGRIDIVFNNAGVLLLAEIEATSEEDARAMFEVNFWGASHVTQESLRVFREENKPRGGRLIQASSGAGALGTPANGYYCATKHALEGLSEAAMDEVDPSWNIKVTIVQFGAFRTKILGENVNITPNHPAYDGKEFASWQIRKFLMSSRVTGDAEKAIVQVERLSRLENPPRRLLLGKTLLPIVRKKVHGYMSELDSYESWSDDLDIEAAK